AERKEKKEPTEAIYQAALLRFRPILMTTMAALLGGVPLALGTGIGAELRRPLGIAIVGGLIFSQLLTLYTTPVIYLGFDRLARRMSGRIAGVTEMTSTSSLGSTTIVMQFDLGRNIDAAARDVQAAINGARGQLPANLPNNPSYRKVNPADAPILLLALTSELVGRARMYDLAASILQQKLSQVKGVGQVVVGGGALPAVRVE